MIELGPLALLRPWWLLALPAIALAYAFLATRPTGLAAWERAVDPHLMRALRRMGLAVPGAAQRPWLPATLAALIALALCGPATRGGDLTAFRNLDGLVIAADLSRSVSGSAAFPMALSAARLVAEGARARPVALIVYGQDAYEASGFTIDARALGTTIALLDGETVPGAGSNPARALALAAKLFAESRTLAGDVVLVSDGGGLNDEALAQARGLAAKGARVSALFVPAAAEATADRGGLERLTQSGAGKLADVAEPSPVVALAGTRTATRLAASDHAVLAWNDHGRLLLIPALALALLLFRRRA
jgi:Ca-activated chloride channel family protein